MTGTTFGAVPWGPPLGEPVPRLDGRAKVTGSARYAADHTPAGCAHAWPVPAPVAKGTVTAVHRAAAMAEPGALSVLAHDDAPRLGDADDRTLAVLQSPRIAHRGQVVALAVAETLPAARAMAAAVRIECAPVPPDLELTPEHPRLVTPEGAESAQGDFPAAFHGAQVRIDAVYSIPPLHNHPMEPHAATAQWLGGRLVVFDSSQGSNAVRDALAALFELEPDQVSVVSEHVGGGFGAKGTPRPHVVLAAMAAMAVNRPVKLALPRGLLPALTGYRASTLQRVRLGADTEGRVRAIAHEVDTYTSPLSPDWRERATQPTRSLYAAPHRLTRERVAPLDVPSPSWMRAPGECSGMFAVESAMDELAVACAMDPIELRARNEPDVDPHTGRPFSSRHLVECLRAGADRFGWADRDPAPAMRRQGRLLIGSGVAASTYPAEVIPSSARAHANPGGGFLVEINATDIGTGARTVLAQIAASTLGIGVDELEIDIGRTDLPRAPLAGGSCGTASWGWAVHKACGELSRRIDEHQGAVPAGGLTVTVDTTEDLATDDQYTRRSFGAQFAEVAVDVDTGEARVRRLLGVFAAGRILNPRTARSQLLGGMIMGLSMALTETSTLDLAFGDHPERDLASYHVASCADVREIDVHWLAEEDSRLNPMGSKGIGELGIVGTAAAVTNAIHHATGVRVRDLPAQPDALLEAMIAQGRI
ncbi:xanthine dehydrogenase [Wenjunlia vitaminophila]|uniref:Xanthine dehydrogenase n=1 Tax=Wenjunlia vitaminophila TaxID=76728 RepID=A0A0T6LVX4_WENVI|nr:xanthine dehydrogenase family protein molybdopterin-binding subunit [Wenjunlia vitaminophila]KRV49871.1 xanthine dehydrogenase [Wenjunlia vitaminophila]